MTRRQTASVVFLLVLATPLSTRARFTTFDEANGVLTALADVLPPELRLFDPDRVNVWSAWVLQRDREIRDRLHRGDEETIVNWLLFGTSFTKRPRVPAESAATADQTRLAELIAGRALDLAAALATPAQDERRLFAQQLFARQGYAVGTDPERVRLAQHLGTLTTGVLAERAKYAQQLRAIRQSNDVSDQFAAQSKLFRDRGLSLDTSFKPSFALEQALVEMMRRGALKAGAVREVAVIGPGLDFTDKSSGYDFYPQQTLQPFVLIDSLIRVGLVPDVSAITVTTLDLSPRVNDHLTRARQRATAGQPYRFRLPLEPGIKWKPGVVSYWKSAGDRIGNVTPPTPTTVTGTRVDVRTVSVRAPVVRRVQPEDLNIVLQRSDDRRFDLIVATNVFIYYDVLDQALALSNVRAMLRPGGYLLTNNALLELPSTEMHSAGYLTVEYSDTADDGDHIVWYRAN